MQYQPYRLNTAIPINSIRSLCKRLLLNAPLHLPRDVPLVSPPGYVFLLKFFQVVVVGRCVLSLLNCAVLQNSVLGPANDVSAATRPYSPPSRYEPFGSP